jgi:GPH family glycoside/pentoside/hexuronide:cation symporter
LPFSRRIGWAIGDTGINLYWGMIGTFLFFFYTEVMKIPPHWAGIAFALASVWDGVTDPVMGALADRTRTRFGRFRPWILCLSIPSGVAFVMLFWTPPLTGGWLIAYAIASHILFRTLITGVVVPFSAMSASITTDSKVRSSLAALRMIFAGIGGITVAFSVPRIIESVSDPQLAYFLAAAGMAVVATIVLLIAFASSRELPVLTQKVLPKSEQSILESVLADAKAFWGMLLVNGPLARIFLAVILSSIMVTMYSKALLYWVKYDYGDSSVLGWLLPVSGLVVVFASPLWAFVAGLTTKRAVFLAGAFLSILAISLFYITNPREPGLLLALSMVGAFGASAKFVMFWSMLPDTVEYHAWKTGDQSDAKIFGFATLGQKVALAVNAALFGYLLTLIGYVPDTPPTEGTKSAIFAIMCLIPIAGSIISAAFIWGYPIDTKFHARIKQDIRERLEAV